MTNPSHRCDECGGPLDMDDVAVSLQRRILEFQEMYPDVSSAIRPCSAFVIGSDIGGCHQQARHLVMAFALVACDSAFQAWRAECGDLRRKLIPDGRRISFKGLNDNLKRRASRPFLVASDQLNGVLVSIIVEKGVERLFQYGVPADLDPKVRQDIASWKPTAVEQALRLSHIVGILMTLFSSAGQSGIWIADEDEAFANAGRMKTFCALCDNILAGYMQPDIGSMALT